MLVAAVGVGDEQSDLFRDREDPRKEDLLRRRRLRTQRGARNERKTNSDAHLHRLPFLDRPRCCVAVGIRNRRSVGVKTIATQRSEPRNTYDYSAGEETRLYDDPASQWQRAILPRADCLRADTRLHSRQVRLHECRHRSSNTRPDR